MSPDIGIQGAMAMANAAPIAAPHPTANAAAAKRAARQYEGVFIAQLLNQMSEGVPTDGPFGGGPGEAMFRSLMFDEYGKEIAAQGGFGLAGPIANELLKIQERRS